MDAFALLADETRAGILRELAAHRRRDPDGGLAFSELRERVGVRDSGNFNHHLRKLTGRFVADTAAGYRLTPAGTRLAALVAAGFESSESVDAERIDGTCPGCGSPLAVSYEDGVVTVACENDHLLPQSLVQPPAADRDSEGLAAVASLSALQTAECVAAGVCTVCDGVVETELSRTGHEVLPFAYVSTCTVCDTPVTVPPGLVLARHPAVVSFWYERGVDGFETPVWELPVWDADERVVEEDPLALAVTLSLDGDELQMRLDADANATPRE
ncbi:ArsR/SmtB family transcription factor [Halobacterium hubeiense]|uniref:ArsR/SmtB family transcription factor n=1 Tax=Halobacterium hubeiense TaxID=1407499 RepID=UPI003C74F361